MSNIPFNTVASVLGTSSVQRQVANAIDRAKHDSARAQRVQFQKSLQHTEQVEDPGDEGLKGILDQQQKSSHQQREEQERQTSAKVEIAGVEGEEPEGPAAPAAEKPAGPPRLDISA